MRMGILPFAIEICRCRNILEYERVCPEHKVNFTFFHNFTQIRHF